MTPPVPLRPPSYAATADSPRSSTPGVPRRARTCLRGLFGVLALLVLPVLTGCGGPSLGGGAEQGFVTGDGTVAVVPASDRRPPARPVEGEDVEGRPLSVADLRGQVVVMPVWGSWCGPCRAEAPMLAEAARDLADDGVAFLGLNTRDYNRTDARRFAEQFDLPYDSIYDPDGRTMLSFRGTLPPLSIPSFVFLDEEGRVAARVSGEIDRSTLDGVVEEVLGRDLEGGAGQA